MICPPQSLKKVLESSGSDYDYSIISRQIIESEKILQPESVERSFAFRWFRDMLPINETTALSDAETKKLVGLPRGTQKLIFSILGYSVLSLFVPDMGEYDEPPKVVAGNIVAQTSQVKDIIVDNVGEQMIKAGFGVVVDELVVVCDAPRCFQLVAIHLEAFAGDIQKEVFPF